MAEQTLTVPLSKLRENPDNPRKHFAAVPELAETLLTHGVLQRIIVRREADGQLVIVDGHRRFRAAKLAGLKEVPVEVKDLTKQQAYEAMLVSNIQREDISALEQADSYAKLMSDFGLSADEAAARVGVSRARVYSVTRLLDLVEPAKKALQQGKLSAVVAQRIAQVRGERLQLQFLSDVLAMGDKGTVRAVERLLRSRYLEVAKRGLSKRQRETREHGAEVALRRRVLPRLLTRVAELVERRAHLDETDLRTAALALAETGGEAAKEVFQRRGLRADRLSKVGGTQLRSLVLELVFAQWAVLQDGEYSPAVKALAKAYGLSLSELEKGVAAMEKAEGLFSS